MIEIGLRRAVYTAHMCTVIHDHTFILEIGAAIVRSDKGEPASKQTLRDTAGTTGRDGDVFVKLASITLNPKPLSAITYSQQYCVQQ